MKAICSIVFLFFWNFSIAQELPVLSTTSLGNPEQKFDHADNGNYAIDMNNEREQFVGLWEYNENGIIFQLKISKIDMALNKIDNNDIVLNYNYFDRVTLKYKLIKNGTLIFNNLNQIVDWNTAYGTKDHTNYLRGRIKDHTRNVIGSYTIERPLSVPAKIIFNLVLGNYRLLNDPSFYQDGQPLFSIPTGGIEMIKIE
ncbi:DUF6705 family protein [uncultured Flavobacterium sp.]|uniref:DUF6705 family protein n=1 Tax=uncultured Flavobacterium sp. TaxID=165435 RepID=UPI0025FE1DCF|nr:DUF6705 family protein [uncultured Flavobacterium sp.]